MHLSVFANSECLGKAEGAFLALGSFGPVSPIHGVGIGRGELGVKETQPFGKQIHY